jgi:hypothetical protein
MMHSNIYKLKKGFPSSTTVFLVPLVCICHKNWGFSCCQQLVPDKLNHVAFIHGIPVLNESFIQLVVR